MNFDEYQTLAERTEKPLPTMKERLVHAGLGLATETGEVLTEVKRAAIYGKAVDISHIKEELGDILWYIALAANAMDVSLSAIAEANISKLRARFPEAYSDAAAEGRADKNGLDARLS